MWLRYSFFFITISFFIITTMIYKGLFQLKWMQVYRKIFISNHNQAQFGTRQQFKVKRQGPQYTVIQNTCLSQKRYSKFIELAFQNKTIELPFEQTDFNFTIINPQEIIFAFGGDHQNGLIFSQDELINNQMEMSKAKHWIVINGSPTNKLHSLFLPFVHEKHPQVLTRDAIKAALCLKQFLPNYKIAFNSQGAASSVNHLHFQIITTDGLFKNQQLMYQQMSWRSLVLGQQMTYYGVNLSTFQKHGALYLKIDYSKQHKQLPDLIYQLARKAANLDIPHHLLLLDSNFAMLIFRNFATCDVKFGFLEYCQILIAKTPQEFESMTQQYIDEQYQQIALTSQQIANLITQFAKITIKQQPLS